MMFKQIYLVICNNGCDGVEKLWAHSEAAANKRLEESGWGIEKHPSGFKHFCPQCHSNVVPLPEKGDK